MPLRVYRGWLKFVVCVNVAFWYLGGCVIVVGALAPEWTALMVNFFTFNRIASAIAIITAARTRTAELMNLQ